VVLLAVALHYLDMPTWCTAGALLLGLPAAAVARAVVDGISVR